jgi:hypothetical protein
MMGIRITIPEMQLNTQDFSSFSRYRIFSYVLNEQIYIAAWVSIVTRLQVG